MGDRKGVNHSAAARKVHGLRQEVYICSLISLETMAVETMVEKLTRHIHCSATDTTPPTMSLSSMGRVVNQ